jgi:hypothetical protein
MTIIIPKLAVLISPRHPKCDIEKITELQNRLGGDKIPVVALISPE